MALAAVGAWPTTALAQQPESSVSAYLAMIWAPVGSLPPMVQGFDLAARWSGALRYGHMSSGGDRFDNVGVSLDLPIAFGDARTSVTVSRTMSDCETCEPALGAAADVELLLATRDPAAGQLTVSLKPGFGFAVGTSRGDFALFTATVGAPIALRTNGALSVMPYVIPSIGYGLVSGAGNSRGGVRALLGGGVRLQSERTRFGGMAGFQKVFIDGGGTLLGIGLTYGAR